MCNNDLSFNYCIFVTVHFLKVSTEKKMIKMSSWGYLLFPTWQLNISSAQISIQSLRRRKKMESPKSRHWYQKNLFSYSFLQLAETETQQTIQKPDGAAHLSTQLPQGASPPTHEPTEPTLITIRFSQHTHTQIGTTSTEVLNPITYTHKARA